MKFKHVLVRLKEILIQNGWTIATAESLTAGLVASNLASISGSSSYLKGGIAAYTIRIKSDWLEVNEANAEACNAFSIQTAEEMAKGIRKKFETDISIATSGYAEPSPDNNIFVPQAFVTINVKGELSTELIKADGMSRNKARKYIAKQAIQIGSK